MRAGDRPLTFPPSSVYPAIMPLYFAQCQSCRRHADIITHDFHSEAETFEARESCPCGENAWQKVGPQLTARTNKLWEMAAHTRKGVAPPNPYKPKH